MNKNEQIKQLVEAALTSADGADRATPPPYLSTRVNARLNKAGELSFWAKAGLFFSRPAIAFPALILLILINIAAVYFYQKDSSANISEQVTNDTADEFTDANTSIYDIVNNEQ